jgi:ABC-type glycerol-3-phosphate transport system substrate-binding protein
MRSSADSRVAMGRPMVLAAILAGLVAACAGSTPSASSGGGPQGPATSGSIALPSVASPSAGAYPSLAPATLELWLGGILTTSTPGTSYRQWVDAQVNRFKQIYPGSNVNVTLLPQNNDQSAAQVAAALAAGNAPDVMMLYTGTMTSVYESKLRQLNSYIDATPGYYDSQVNWDGGCHNWDCQNGKGVIFAVPADTYMYVNFYRKDLFQKAGIDAPPTTWEETYADCAKLKSSGVYGFIWGDRDGYATVTTFDEDIVSYLQAGEWRGGLDNSLKFTDPRFIQSLQSITKLRDIGCIQPDYATREQLDSANDFLTGKGAMFVGQPQFLPYWTKVIDNVGVGPVPQGGTGPNVGKTSAASGEDWMIPTDAKHPDLAWQLIRILTDDVAGATMPSLLGSPPANKAALAAVTDPRVKAIADLAQKGVMGFYDNIVPQDVALIWYKHLNLAFAGKETIQQAEQATQDQMDKDIPPH